MQTETKQPSMDEPLTSLPKRWVGKKRWKLTLADNLDPIRRTRNSVIDMTYMALLPKVKAMYQGSGIQAFERDLRQDRSFTAAGMHIFCTSDLYLELECGYDLLCIVKYDFGRCPDQQSITQLLHSTYALNEAAVHTTLPGGVSAYYERVIAFQGSSYLSTL